MMTQIRPQPGEYAAFYEKYIALVPDGDLLANLEAGAQQWNSLLDGLTELEGDFAYAPGKWTIKESLGHVTDTERIFSCRLLRIARGDQTPLPGFEQDDYVREGNFNARNLKDLQEEFAAVRQGTVTLLRSLPGRAWTRRGNANQKEVTVTALGFIIAGHERHHHTLVRERYLPALPRG